MSSLETAHAELEAGHVKLSVDAFNSTVEAAVADSALSLSLHDALQYLLQLAQKPGDHFADCFFLFALWWSAQDSNPSQGDLGQTLALTAELAALPSTYPHEVRRALAAAIAKGDAVHANQAIESWSNVRRGEAARAQADLEKIAPLLYRVVGGAFLKSQWAWGSDDPKYNWKVWTIAAAFMLAFARWGPSASTPTDYENLTGIRRDQIVIMDFHDAIDAVCASADSVACETAADVRRAVGRNDCEAAYTLMMSLTDGAPNADSSELRVKLEHACSR